MRTQSAIRSPRVSPVDDIVDALATSASSALANLDVRSASAKPRLYIAPTVSAAPSTSNSWLQPAAVETTSRFGKSGMFVLVALVHVVAFALLSYMSPQVKHSDEQPIQVVMVSDLQNKDVPQPPVQLPRMPTFDLPIEPVVINIADPDTTAITVAARPVEPAAAPASAAVGTPKTVSSVEYIREPIVKYPQAARVLKQRGTVTLRALIGTEGIAQEVDVQNSSGFRVLDDAARAAVLNALFKPYIEGGHALPVYVFIPIEFGLASR
jgi:protein TonB